MAKILRPRRGTASVAKSQLKDNNKLASGEVFFELPDGGSWGQSEGRIIMGDGNNAYQNLKAFIDPTNYVHKGQTQEQSIQFTETSSTDNAALLKTIVSGVSIKNAFAGIKNLLSNLNSSVTQLNNDLDKSKSDIEYHWGEIEKKVPSRTSTTYNGNELKLPPIIVLRQLTEARDPDTDIAYDKSYTIASGSSKWYSVTS